MIFYADTDVCAYHLECLGITPVRDFEEFLITPGPKRALFHIPFPWKGGYGHLFIGRVDRAYQVCDQIIVLCSEIHNATHEFIKAWDQPKMSFFLSGYLNRQFNSYVGQWQDWFIRTVGCYKNNNLLDQLSPYTVKPKYFDVLLGQPRLHRDVMYASVKEHGLADDVVMTYMRDFSQGLYDHDFNAISLQSRPATEWSWGVTGLDVPKDDLHFTIESINYQGHTMSLSQLIPFDIYNQTAYTIVSETNYMNSFTFYTEKTVKPILAERLFIGVCGQHYLHNLRNAGFKTFDCVIDESYDEEPDVARRITMIAEQMRYLISQPQEHILEKIRPITKYNKKLMLEHDWLGEFHKNLSAQINGL